MKKLCKIKLNDAAIMTDSEMKYIFGGTGVETGVDTDAGYTGIVECQNNTSEDGCADEGARCIVSPSILRGKCEWRTYSDITHGTMSLCNCVYRKERF